MRSSTIHTVQGLFPFGHLYIQFGPYPVAIGQVTVRSNREVLKAWWKHTFPTRRQVMPCHAFDMYISQTKKSKGTKTHQYLLPLNLGSWQTTWTTMVVSLMLVF